MTDEAKIAVAIAKGWLFLAEVSLQDERGNLMNRAEETALAWALVDSATTLLTTRATLWIKIGAGDQDGAIVEVLTLYARSHAEMPTELAHTVDDWIRGYSGADAELMLRELRARISVSPSIDATERPRAIPAQRQNSDRVGPARGANVNSVARPGLAQT